jgi:hypothetical protein
MVIKMKKKLMIMICVFLVTIEAQLTCKTVQVARDARQYFWRTRQNTSFRSLVKTLISEHLTPFSPRVKEGEKRIFGGPGYVMNTRSRQ